MEEKNDGIKRGVAQVVVNQGHAETNADNRYRSILKVLMKVPGKNFLIAMTIIICTCIYIKTPPAWLWNSHFMAIALYEDDPKFLLKSETWKFIKEHASTTRLDAMLDIVCDGQHPNLYKWFEVNEPELWKETMEHPEDAAVQDGLVGELRIKLKNERRRKHSLLAWFYDSPERLIKHGILPGDLSPQWFAEVVKRCTADNRPRLYKYLTGEELGQAIDELPPDRKKLYQDYYNELRK